MKQQTGLVWNEISRRYVDDDPDFWTPEHWRGRADDKKQGSSEEYVDWVDRNERTGHLAIDVSKFAVDAYKRMLEAGVCPEQARMVLPQNMITEWYWSGSLYAFARVCNLRCKPDAQLETQDVCWELDNLARDLFPVSWLALR